MANRERGEVDLVVTRTIEGVEKEYTYTLKLSTNVAVAVETRLNRKLGDIMVDATSLSFKALRTLIWLLLQKYHAKDFKSEESAGDLIDDAGGVAGVFVKLTEIAEVNRPEKGDGAPENPPAAQGETADGTGEPSTSAPDESA